MSWSLDTGLQLFLPGVPDLHAMRETHRLSGYEMEVARLNEEATDVDESGHNARVYNGAA